jgi:hypothetical protein
MTIHRCIGLSIGLLTLAGGGFVSRTSAQVELVPNTIQGQVRFSNINPAILDLLNPPSNEGMSNLYVYAYSLPPQNRTASSDFLNAATRTQTSYELAVDSDATGIAYVVTPRVSMLDQKETYYFVPATSEPVVAFLPGPTVDFTECLGVLTVHFVDSGGLPLAIDDGSLVVNTEDGTAEICRFDGIPIGATEQRIYLRGGTAAKLTMTVSRGTSTFTDRIQYSTVTNVMAPCDGFADIDIVIPGAGALGRATGNVDMLREFEATVDGYDAGDYPDYTSVVAQFGPFGNKRYAAVPGVNFTTPASGPFALANLVPSTLDPASVGYAVWAEMYVRAGTAIEYFRTPALGYGANPPLVVEPGASLDLGDRFVVDPGYMRGNVLLQGPAESLGRASLLRGVAFASDYDTDGDGIPDALGIYGVYYSSIGANGVDRAATDATFTASGGFGYTGFKGSFNPATSAYAGQYELALGGLNGERSLWNRNYLSLVATSGTVDNDNNYYYYGLSITDTTAPDTEIVPNQAVTSDVAYCFSEVNITFRSTEPFYNPNIRFSYGGFTNIDFQGRPVSYSVYVDPAVGVPSAQANAATEGHVLMYLPQGSYHLTPYVTPADSTFASVSGDAIDITVGCGERIGVAQCLQVELAPIDCAGADPIHAVGTVRSCNNEVETITYQLNDGPVQTICNNCGVNPSFAFNFTAAPGMDNTLTVTASNAVSGAASITTHIRSDATPPVIQCPDDITITAAEAAGAMLDYTVTASDDQPGLVQVNCMPPSGSLFPVGASPVGCTATDGCGNASTCSFTVTVLPPTDDCIQVFIEPPMCTTNFGFLARANATSCDGTLTNLSLRASPLSDPSIRLGYSDIRILIGSRSELTTAHGLFPEFDGFDRSLYQDIVYTATALDNKGRIATRQIIAHYDFTPPVLDCTDITVTSANGIDAVVDYDIPTSSDGILVCVPPSGTTFPVGTTPVICTARDLCHNTNTCSFNVIVRGPNEDCVLRIALTQISPPEVTLTWDCVATLQSADTVDGPWTSLIGVTSPHTRPADGPQKFFRLCLSGDCDSTPPPLPAVYEPFDYLHATPLGNQNGGVGFAGAWDPAASLIIEESSLAFNPLATTGGSASGSGGFGGSRLLAAPLGTDGSTVYLSFLLRPGNASESGTVDGYYGISLFGSTGGLFIGKPGAQGGGVGISQEYVLEDYGGTSQVSAGAAVTPNQTVLLVVKCVFAAGNDTFTLYVDPIPSAAEPVAGAVKNDTDIGTCGVLTISSGYDSSHTFTLDEIRLGATFESVTPGP